MAVTRPAIFDPRVDHLAEQVYDHFLREAGDYTNPDEWYEIAAAVADRFKETIQQSRDRNMFRAGPSGGCLPGALDGEK